MSAERVGERLNALLVEAGVDPVDEEAAEKFEAYLALILKWNARVNLTSLRTDDVILSRHFVESIACARALPRGIGSLLDFGSGAGLPGIPIALCRPEIEVTLAESQGKKAAFLQEAVRVVGIGAGVLGGRAETAGRVFDCVVLRAVERMAKAVGAGAGLVGENGWLAVMTTDGELGNVRAAAGTEFEWEEPVRVPGGERRMLALGRKVGLGSRVGG